MTTSLTSELEAINTMLGAISEAPINSLEGHGLADAARAQAVLAEFIREVQAVGWHFNTEEEYPLARDAESRIFVPSGALKVAVQGDPTVIQRGAKLYDKARHSDIFEKDLKATVVFLLPWDELPQAARHYIMVRASRVFQARSLGSDSQFQFSAEEEAAAEKALKEAEGETGNYNIFAGSAVQSIMER